MVWGFKENKFSVNALHKVVMETSFIFKGLQKLGISRVFVYFTINRYIITFSVENHKDWGGRVPLELQRLFMLLDQNMTKPHNEKKRKKCSVITTTLPRV